MISIKISNEKKRYMDTPPPPLDNLKTALYNAG